MKIGELSNAAKAYTLFSWQVSCRYATPRTDENGLGAGYTPGCISVADRGRIVFAERSAHEQVGRDLLPIRTCCPRRRGARRGNCPISRRSSAVVMPPGAPVSAGMQQRRSNLE